MMRTLYANSLHVYIYVYLAVCRSPGTRSLQCITIEAMSSRLRHWLDDPLVLLCVAAGLLAFVVQSGELGTADTMHRLQTTHWLWTSEPQVFPND
jgi:hypothetical protein